MLCLQSAWLVSGRACATFERQVQHVTLNRPLLSLAPWSSTTFEAAVQPGRAVLQCIACSVTKAHQHWSKEHIAHASTAERGSLSVSMLHQQCMGLTASQRSQKGLSFIQPLTAANLTSSSRTSSSRFPASSPPESCLLGCLDVSFKPSPALDAAGKSPSQQSTTVSWPIEC